jgi:general secretion pathway protein J
MRSEAGFTLVELLISLALFALIGMAGVALVESVIGVQEKTRARLDRITEIRRASFLIGLDLDQAEGGGFQGDAASLRFRRHGFPGRESVATVRYSVHGGALTRQVDDGPAQPLLRGVAQGRWRYFETGRGWNDQWQAADATAGGLPAGVALDISLADGGEGPAGMFRRVIALPRPPP